MTALEWAGCIFGLCGSAMLALNNRYSGLGFIFFMISNLAWLFFGLIIHANALVVMQIGFMATSATGIWQWLIIGKRKN